MIEEIIKNNPKTSFVCNNFEEVKEFFNDCEKECIVFSKSLTKDIVYIQKYGELLETHFVTIHTDHPFHLLVVNTGDEYQFYARSDKGKENYNDWGDYIFINWTKHRRGKIVNNLLDL